MGWWPQGNSNFLSIREVNEWRLFGQEAVTLINEDFGPILYNSSSLSTYGDRT